MKLTFLGVSSALVTGHHCYQSNMVLESTSGHHLLIDCGSDIRHALFKQGMSHTDIDAVYISHLHADHVGGLEWLGFSSRFVDGKRPKLYISPSLQTTLWEHVLSGSMASLETEVASLESFFEVQSIHDNMFIWEKYRFQLIQVTHSMSHHKPLPCFGLLITGSEKKVFISTDTRFTPNELMPIYQISDLIFHDCEVQSFESGQHATYTKLNTLDTNIKRKMWLYDYGNEPLPDAEKDGFKGFVVRGQSFYI